MKTVSRNKFLLCFRPVVDVDHLVLDSNNGFDCSNNQDLAYVSMEKKEIMKNSAFNSSLPDSRCSSTSSSENSLILHPPKKPFSRLIKAVLFETILSKRARDHGKGLCQDSYASKQGFSLLRQKSFDNIIDDKVLINTHDIKSNSELSCSSSFDSSSSRSSSISGRSKTLSNIKNNTKPNQELEVKPKKKMGQDNSSIYLFLVSITVTIFWGKLCAIIFTLIWLYFLHRRHVKDEICQQKGFSTRLQLKEKKGSKEHKKRVIMAGLLERNHHQRIAEDWH